MNSLTSRYNPEIDQAFGSAPAIIPFLIVVIGSTDDYGNEAGPYRKETKDSPKIWASEKKKEERRI